MDKFSKKVRAEFINAFPEWEKFCSIAMDEGEEVLSVKIPSPSRGEKFPLSLDTCQSEVTVAFDAYHAHFNDFINPEGYDAISFINELISSDNAVVSYWRDDKWCGSTMLPASNLPTSNEEYPYANLIKIRSWSGSCDNEIQCTSKD